MESMTLNHVKRRVRLAEAYGCGIDRVDYDYGSAAIAKNGKAIWMTQVFRPERDGYDGHKMISMDVLREWLGDQAGQRHV